uniref:Late embryogenesis abundant protein LEA-2 subgroup domain-containing protein n=1 Tax=Davidia involucrata TaxID=16924 RepID=A0A5B7A2R2_DAVIN
MSYPQPPYVMLSENNGGIRPPPYRRNIPQYQTNNQKKRGNRCVRCICCCYCCLFLLILISAAIFFYFYAFVQPKMPTYQVQGLQVKAFDVQMDFSLNTEFLVTVKAENPNENIGFVYGKDSSVTVSYTDSTLCSGKLPAFHQGKKNITMMKVDLKGKSEFGSGLQEALMKNQKGGRIPLLVRVEAPVSIVLGETQMRQFVAHVNCSLVVDNLSPNKKIGILESKYTLGFTF